MIWPPEPKPSIYFIHPLKLKIKETLIDKYLECETYP